MIQSRLRKIILTATLSIFFFAAFTVVASADRLYDSSGETNTTNQSVVGAASPPYAHSEKRQLEAIRAAIEEKGANWTAGKTSVSDLSLEEKRRLCGLKLPPEGLQPAPAEEEKKMELFGQYPTAFDWRNNGGDWTTSIKNQRKPKSCGSCWAFGSVAAFEAQIDIVANESTVDTNLSEQYMLSCSAGDCDGYTLPGTMDFLRDTGTCDEACFSYQADDTIPCGDACPYCEGRMWKLASWGYISPNATAVKEKIQQAPVVAGMRVYGDFAVYTVGVYEHTYGSYIGNHLIAIVGWSDTEQCWICKNSWGTDWGEDTYGVTGEKGWFRIKYGECDLATNLSNFQAYATFDLPKKVISCDSGGTEKDSFVPGDKAYIKALGLSPSTNYTVWIQVNPVNESDSLVLGEDPSPSQENVTTDANGNNLSSVLIWSIPSEAPATCTEYDIVLDNQDAGTVGTYNAADDAIDSATVAGILAPVPEAPTIVLFSVGLLVLAGYSWLRRKKKT